MLSLLALLKLLTVAMSAVPLATPASGLVASGAAGLLGLSKSSSKWHGVSLGGWLVMEINPTTRGPDDPIDLRPQWMYDQFEARSELDFITALRKDKGDEYAITTMKNHWDLYLSITAM